MLRPESVLPEIRAEFIRNLQGRSVFVASETTDDPGLKTVDESAQEALVRKMQEAIQVQVALNRRAPQNPFMVWLDNQSTGSGTNSDSVKRLVRRLVAADTPNFAPGDQRQLAGLGESRDENSFPSLIGFSIMRVEPKFNEIYYTDLLSEVHSWETDGFVRETVAVRGNRHEGVITWKGSVGQAVMSQERRVCVPNAFIDPKGEVASADLIGGNRSILMRAVPAAPMTDARQPHPDVVAVVFCFAPFEDFFKESDAIADAFYRAVDANSASVRNYLILQDAAERQRMLDEIKKAQEDTGEIDGLLLQSFVTRDTRHTEIGAVAGMHLVDGNVESVDFCTKFLRDSEVAEWLYKAETGVTLYNLSHDNSYDATIVVRGDPDDRTSHPGAPMLLSRKLSSILDKLWVQHRECLQKGSGCVSDIERGQLSIPCGQAKVAADLARTLVDAVVVRLGNQIDHRGERLPPDAHLKLILTVADAQFQLKLRPEQDSEDIMSDIKRAAERNAWGLAVVGRLKSDPAQGFWKTHAWAALTNNGLKLLRRLINLSEIADAAARCASGSTVLEPFGETEWTRVDVGKDNSGRAHAFVVLGLRPLSEFSYTEIVEQSQIVTLVKLLYGSVLKKMQVEQEFLKQYTCRVSTKVASVADLALRRLTDNEASHSQTLARRILSLSNPPLGDRRQLLAFVDTMHALRGQLRYIHDETTSLSLIVRRNGDQDSWRKLRPRGDHLEVGAIVTAAFIRGAAAAMNRLTDGDLAALSGRQSARDVRRLRRGLLGALTFAEVSGDDDWFATAQRVGRLLPFKPVTMDVETLKGRRCDAATAGLVDTILTELFQNAIVGAARSKAHGDISRLALRHSLLGNGVDELVVANTVAESDLKNLNDWRAARHGNGDGFANFRGIEMIARLCANLGMELEFRPVDQDIVTIAFRAKLLRGDGPCRTSN